MSEYATSARFNLVPVTEEENEDLMDEDSDSGIDKGKTKDEMVATPKSQVEVTVQKRSPKLDKRPQDDQNIISDDDNDLEYEEIIQFLKDDDDDDDISYDTKDPDKHQEASSDVTSSLHSLKGDSEVLIHVDLERLTSDDSNTMHLSSTLSVRNSGTNPSLEKVCFRINHLQKDLINTSPS